jgi:hypothetical protein
MNAACTLLQGFQRIDAIAGYAMNQATEVFWFRAAMPRPGGDREMAEILALVLHHDDQRRVTSIAPSSTSHAGAPRSPIEKTISPGAKRRSAPFAKRLAVEICVAFSTGNI